MPTLPANPTAATQFMANQALAAGITNTTPLDRLGNLEQIVGNLLAGLVAFNDAVTAHAGGGQAAATALVQGFNRVSTVATAGDSVKLPAAALGQFTFILNDSAKNLAVFGTGTDTVNGVAAATGILQPPNSLVVYGGITGGWKSTALAGYSASLIVELAQNGLTAHAGGGQGSALALAAEINGVTTVATAGDSVALPASAPGLDILVINTASNACNVFPATGDAINGQAANTAVSQIGQSVVLYVCRVAGNWETEGIGTGYFGAFQTVAGANAITAHAGGGQGSATALTNMVNRISVCATAGDSVGLPATTGLPASAALELVVINDGATSCNVFPATGDTINGLAANSAFAVPAGQTVTFSSTVAGAWQTTPATIPLPVQWNQDTTSGATTAAAGLLTGAYECVVNITAIGAANYTTRTAAQLIADGALKIGQKYKVVIVNTNAGTTTLVGGSGVTITGTATIAQNISRAYQVTVTGASTITFQEMYSGAQ